MNSTASIPSSYTKPVLVLADSRLLLDVIAASLDCPIQGFLLGGDDMAFSAQKQTAFDLIIVALSAPSGEPLVTLKRAGVLQDVGRVPVLIISDRRFDSLSKDKIFYLPFPFSAAALRCRVGELLTPSRGEPQWRV